MINEEQSQLPAKLERSGDYDLLLYDYSKHLLSLALISIGGVITLAQSGAIVGRQDDSDPGYRRRGHHLGTERCCGAVVHRCCASRSQ
jgi:hypothetical protein